MLRLNSTPNPSNAFNKRIFDKKRILGGSTFLVTFLMMILIGTVVCLRNVDFFSSRDLSGKQSSLRGATVTDDSDKSTESEGGEDRTSMIPSSTIPSDFTNAVSQLAVTDKDLDWDDTIFQHFESDNDPVVLESHKLLFFTVPKNSCTEWKQLFRRMMGYEDWNKPPFLHPHDPRTNGLSYLGTYDKDKQEEFMTSPEWTRAIFIRDPLERMLSAYLNKGLSEERYIKRWCCKISPKETEEERQSELEYLEKTNPSCVPLAPWETQPNVDTFTFETFVNEFMFQCNDKHWRPQSQRMYPNNWKFLNFIGRMENLHEDAKKLLQKIGAWDEFGSNGWGKYENMSMFERARSDSTNTHSKDRFAQFYTPELKKKALEYLKGDYQNKYLNFTLPDDVDESSI
ncbi:sulfotransferase family protein [Nitzschia inconspicua]|uniref:Sulfotransferase family protein n=1 Tax=Nitzschia inconspicua TaxID=303405 RepID=A0A9K3L096_9STRA|nr:sulfotransferase family protein [Nitzschia inconspicua]